MLENEMGGRDNTWEATIVNNQEELIGFVRCTVCEEKLHGSIRQILIKM